MAEWSVWTESHFNPCLGQSRCRQGSAMTGWNLKLNQAAIFTDFKQINANQISRVCFTNFKMVQNFKISAKMFKLMLFKKDSIYP